MTSILYVMRKRWMKTLLAVLVLSLLVWFFGTLLGLGQAHPLDTATARLLVIAMLLALWLVSNLIREVQISRKDRALVDGVLAAYDPDNSTSVEEMALRRDRLRQALHAPKRSKVNGREKRHIASLPWYIIVGPPGAGKTTALLNSGLGFPLAGKQGAQALASIGGSRDCAWWLTDQAVLIDTAFRDSTQDSDQAADCAAWLGFLRSIKRHRARQPLNGVLVAVSLADLAQWSEADRLAHARSIRARVRELHEQLGVRLPVYILFTKADLIAGFVEFFNGLSREEREQVWGMTFPVIDAADKTSVAAQFDAAFDRLLARLNDRMLRRMHQEPDIAHRWLIYGFPHQFASLRDVAGAFMAEIFPPDPMEMRPLLRGAYFTSGTQDGTPIDRLFGAVASQFGLQRQAGTPFCGTARSYFLARLMRDVVFADAGLAGLDVKAERRKQLLENGACAGAAALLLLCIGLWIASFAGNRGLIAQMHDQVRQYKAQHATLAALGTHDIDLPPLLPPLDTARNFHGGYADRARAAPMLLTFGLYQGRKLATAAIAGYTHALNALLLPRLLARLEGQMREHLDQPGFLHHALKVYLILGRQAPLEREPVEHWLNADLAASFPGDDDAGIRSALAGHVDALLEQPLTAIALDGPLVAQVRDILIRGAAARRQP